MDVLGLEPDLDDPSGGGLFMAVSIKDPSLRLECEFDEDGGATKVNGSAESGSAIYMDMQGAIPMPFIIAACRHLCRDLD